MVGGNSGLVVPVMTTEMGFKILKGRSTEESQAAGASYFSFSEFDCINGFPKYTYFG